MPDDRDVIMRLALGYPFNDRAFDPTTDRLALDKIAFAEKFGDAWATAPKWNKPSPWVGSPPQTFAFWPWVILAGAFPGARNLTTTQHSALQCLSLMGVG